jgi:hypothetical protein
MESILIFRKLLKIRWFFLEVPVKDCLMGLLLVILLLVKWNPAEIRWIPAVLAKKPAGMRRNPADIGPNPVGI